MRGCGSEGPVRRKAKFFGDGIGKPDREIDRLVFAETTGPCVAAGPLAATVETGDRRAFRMKFRFVRFLPS